jgi:glyceraldehyde 3-phosphate dehydrogenase
MARLKIGLNGFGRIGRTFTRIALMRDSFDIVAINTRKTSPEMLAYLLKYDSIYRTFDKSVSHTDNELVIDGKKIAVTQNDDPTEIPWDTYGVDVVIDATGAFTKKEDLQKHLKGSVKKVILTAPAKDEETPHVVLGVNDDTIDWKQETVISNASCTTNCASPMFKLLDEAFEIVTGSLTTIHAYTQSQTLQDDPNKEFDRSRSATLNIVPSTTGAAKAVVKTLPHLKGKIDGMAIRIPVPTVSFSDITALVKKKTTVEEINNVFKTASETTMKRILSYETNLLVSSDFIGSPYSCVFDANYTKVMNGYFVKVFGWYDNEWGYSSRLVDLVEKVSQQM